MRSRPDNEAQLAAIVSSSSDAIISQDLNGIITSWNPAAEQMFGYSATEAVGQNILLIIPEDRHREEDDVVAQVRQGHAVDHYETVRRCKDGTFLDIFLTVAPIVAGGVVIGASQIARDVTAARRHEREAFRLAAIVMSSEDAIVAKDLDGTIRSWNRGAEKIFGYTADEAIGKNITMIVPDDRHSEEQEVLSRIRSGESVEHFETVRRRKDGSLLHMSLSVSPIRDARGRITGVSKIARDVTAQRRLHDQAEEASRQKDEFLAVLSHELRTPLNTVLGYARMLRREDERMTDGLRERALDALERNADTLTRLVNDVLDTSRIVTGKLRLDMAICAVDETVEAAVEVMQPTADAKGVTLRTQLAEGLTVSGDGERLQQVVWNLLSNAIKFTPPGGTVTVRVERVASAARIVVEDTGIGIARADLPYIFRRFWQAHTGASREYGGLGIGLTLARHLVELHGGAIAVESGGTGRGSTFTVTLPLAVGRERHLRAIR